MDERQARDGSTHGQSLLILAGVKFCSLPRSSQSTGPADVPLHGVWASGSRRSQRRAQFGATLWGSRTGNLQKQGRGQSLALAATWRMEAEKWVGRSPTRRPVGSLG